MANGVLGLAPSSNSIINALYRADIIESPIIGINLENPMDDDQRSQVSLGFVDYDEVDGGEEGVNYYSNLAIDNWGLLMDDFLYNDTDMTDDRKAKVALIDSGNTSIQIPQTMYNNVMREMRKTVKEIYS